MKISKREREFLTTLVFAQKMLDASATPGGREARKRRSPADVARLRKQILAARRRNVPVKRIADELGVTPAYVYQLTR